MKKTVLLFVLALMGVGFSASACTAMLVGKKASATGHVLVGHNFDMLDCYMRHAQLPRRGDKPEMFWSQVKRRKGGDVCAHFFYNEWGVAIGSNNGGVMNSWDGATFQLPDEGYYSTVTDGGIGYELRIRAVEGAHSARACVARMADLIDRYGYNQTSRNFFIADADEAWLFMALYGRRYVARRVPDDQIVAYPNCLVFNRLQPGDIASKNILEKGPDFDVIAYYQGPRTWKSPYNIYRWMDFYRLSAGVELPAEGDYPFGVVPAHPISVEDIKKGLCSHYEGRPYEVKDRHPARNQKIVVPICRGGTLEALVCQFSPKVSETELHMTVGRPCESAYGVYRPFAGVLPADTVFGAQAVERLANYSAVPEPVTKVALYVGLGARSNGCTEWIRLLSGAPGFELTFVDHESIAADGLKGMDLLVMPGGDSRTIRRSIGDAGAEAIRAFVRTGGGYLGTCAGCCLALDAKADPERGIGLIPYHRVAHKSHAMMPVCFTEAGSQALGITNLVQAIRYSKGPILERIESSDPEMKIETWGEYAGDLAEEPRDVVMAGHPAVVGGTFGKGRVFAIACHPESFTCTRDITRAALAYVSGRSVLFPARPRQTQALTVGYFTAAMTGLASAQAIRRLEAEESIDLFPIAADEINFNMLDHVDVLILPDGVPAWYERNRPTIAFGLRDFLARGGKVYGWGAGAALVPPSGKVCASFGEILTELLDRF